MRKLIALLLAWSLLAGPAVAAEGDNMEAQAGKLRIIHLWTTAPDEFLAAWAGPTPPNLPTSTSSRRNEPISQFILHTDCTADKNGLCHLGARVEITAPDGTPYGEPMVFDAVPPSPAGRPGMIVMAPNSIGLVVEDGEQLGTYRVRLLVTDVVAGVTAESVVSLEISEAG